MVTKPGENDPPDDDEDNPAFLKYLEKNIPWLTEKLKPSLSLPAPKSTDQDPLTALLNKLLDETKTEAKTLAQQLAELRDMLTPEQLALLKSRKSAGEGDPGNPPTPGKPPSDPPKPSDPPPKKKSRFL